MATIHGNSHGSDQTPSLAPFLQSSREDIMNKFIDLEWQQRDRLAHGATNANNSSQWARLSNETVSKRNRYNNIDPFVSNRVHLHVPEGQNDYINASYISLKSSKDGKERKYIATQGPSEYSLHHLWRMVWHESSDVAVIVMLTQTYEAGREKCYQYFPLDENSSIMQINEQDEYQDDFRGTIELVESKYDTLSRSTVRKLQFSIGNQSKTVWHYLFNGWPDFLVPEDEDRTALIELIKQSSLKTHDPANPRIVHCSAGVGRSGTFIALDHLLNELEEGSLAKVPAEDDLIFDTVDELRKQRMMMVQGEAQFFFLYEILKEQWLNHYQIKGTTVKTSQTKA